MHDHGVIWITGASSGIGKALALELSARGATLVLTARRGAQLREVRDACPHPERTHLLAGDLLDPTAWEALPAKAAALAGPIGMLINNAGISQRATAEDTRLQDVRRIMELNFFAPVALTQAVLPAMRSAGRGRVVIISSVAGYVGTPLRSTYAASKHAVRGYFDSLRAELDGSGVGVSIICPGYIQTEITENAVAAGGARHGVRDAAIKNGMPVDACATRIADALDRGQSELLVGGKETLAVYLKRLLPGIVERVVPRQAPS